MKKPTKKELHEQSREEAKKKLLSMLNGNRTIYTNLKSVSSSGMSRHIQVLAVIDGQIRNITYWASIILDYKIGKTGGLVVGGCGMDMGFHVVYSLSRCLFPDGFEVPQGQYGRNGDKGGWDKDGGYCLQQEWI